MAEPQTPPPDNTMGPDMFLPPAPRRRKRGFFARLAVAGFSAVLMAGVACIALFVLLSQGPMSVPFIKDRLADALETRLGAGINVTVGDAKLEKTGDGLEVHVYDVVFRGPKGKEILRSPEAMVALDPIQLAALRLAPRRLALQGITIRAEVKPDGEVRLSTGIAAGEPTQATRLDEALGFLLEVARTGTFSGLSDVSITDARLVIDDQRVGREIAFDRMSAVFASPGAGRSTLTGSINRAGETVPFSLEAVGHSEGAVLNLKLDRLSQRLIETLGGAVPLPFLTTSTATATASLTLGAEGKPVKGSARIALTKGQFTVPAMGGGAFAIDEALVEADWGGDAARIDKLTFRFAGDGSKGMLTGPMLLAADGRTEHRYDARIEGLVLSPVAPQEQPVTVTSGQLALLLRADGEKLTVERLEIKGPDTAIQLSGSIARADGGAAASLQLTAGPMPVRTALRWWPPFVSPSGRTYLASTVREGTLTAFALQLDLPAPSFKAMINLEALPVNDVKLDASFENGSMQVLDDLPPIAGMQGTVTLNALQAQANVSRGVIDLKGAGRRIQLSDGKLSINRLDTWTPDLSVAFRAQSGLENVAEVFTLPGLRDVIALRINPADIRGAFDGVATISMTLGAPLKPGDIGTALTATVRNMTLEKAIGRDKLENANLTVTADRTGIDVKGEGRWQGMPVTIGMESDSIDRSLAAVMSFTLDDAAQKRMGLGAQISGPLPVKVKALREDGEGMRAQAEVDLTRASIDGLIPGFQKPAGRGGKLTFEAVEKAKGYVFQNIALDSGASSFRGQAEALPDGTVTSARFSLFRLSPGDNVRLDFDRTQGGGKVVIRGNNFDARPFLKAAQQDGPASPKADRDMDLELKTTLLSGHGGEVLTNADVKMQRRGGQVRQFAMTGRLNGKAVSVTGQGGDRAAPITIESDDAGAFLRFIDLYTRMSGGDLQGEIRPSGRDMSGYMIARDFRLRDEPALRRLLAETPPEAGVRVGDSAAFTKMRVDFSRSGTATTVKDAVIFGPQIGLTFNGIIDTVRDRVSMSGTFVPAYGLNNAFAQIPVLGAILGGGRNEGLLAVTFGVSGRASQPSVTVNPLSAVTPGIFRKIFEFRNDRTGTAAPANPNVVPPTAN